ncbi:MAG: hypothetical protein JNK58_02080 [Phycisphaerae bacterium]|nr:hypothetical protein [Phycisphaerae bacterium]
MKSPARSAVPASTPWLAPLCVLTHWHLAFQPVSAGDFADEVVSYSPAPGQFVNNPLYNNPARALGPPAAGGTLAGDNSKAVTLGGFGGSIVLRFAETVRDDPCNPFGLDAIVFGNAFWVAGNGNRRWAEPAVIEISLDANHNGIADDAWYVIPGSHGPLPIESQAWDNNAGTSTPPANLAWYPVGAPGMIVTSTFALPALFDTLVLQNPNGLGALIEGVWGYAECSPTLLLGDTNADNVVDSPSLSAAEFYTSPDNPFAVGVTPSSGGGDSFDIAWAIDAQTLQPARLPGFDFIRLSSAVNFIAGSLGEISAEISAVSDVRAREAFFDRTGDALADIEDLYSWHALRQAGSPAADVNGDSAVTDVDRAMMQRAVRKDRVGE